MGISLLDILKTYAEDIGLLIDEPIEVSTTNPEFQQDAQFPGAFLEKNSPVEDIYEYEGILTEEGNAPDNTTNEDSSPTIPVVSTNAGSSTGY